MSFLTNGAFVGSLDVAEVYLYYEGPRLFLATNGATQKFLVNCLDDDEHSETWLATALSDRRIESLRSAQISLRDAFTTPETGSLFEITSNLDRQITSVRARVPQELTDDMLPAIGMFLPRQTALGHQIIPEAASLARTLNTDVILMRLFPQSRSHEAPANKLGKVLSSLDDYIHQRVDSFRDALGVPLGLLHPLELNVVGTFAGSFGVELAVRGNVTESWPAVSDAISALDSARETETFKELMLGAEPAEIKAMKNFLHQVSLANTDLLITTASASRSESVSASIPHFQVKNAVASFERERRTRRVSMTVTGNLLGLNLRAKRFELNAIDGLHVYKGVIRGEIFSVLSTAELPSTYRVALEADLPLDYGEDLSRAVWRMLSATKV